MYPLLQNLISEISFPLTDHQEQPIEKTPEASLPAPTLPGATQSLIIRETSCPLAPRVLRFTDIPSTGNSASRGEQHHIKKIHATSIAT